MGYAVLPNVVSLRLCEAVARYVRVKDDGWQIMRNNAPVFSPNNDGRRLQSDTLSKEVLENLGLDLKALCIRECVWEEGDSIEEPTFLLSLPGCLDQLMHQDYNDFPDGMLDTDVPRSCILALESFHILVADGVYGGRSGEGVNVKRLFVPQGALLVFRGDLRHAGSLTEKECLRLHFFLDKPGVIGGKHPSGYTVGD